jgi:hypothetical protein
MSALKVKDSVSSILTLFPISGQKIYFIREKYIVVRANHCPPEIVSYFWTCERAPTFTYMWYDMQCVADKGGPENGSSPVAAFCGKKS